eukprot:GABV01000230.1.p1 GENE.GABV01000230.1~~GABV01000230.1.p1  ORF type:complete len:465 (-),score=101.36 GABV01000230.1:81-1475(-)
MSCLGNWSEPASPCVPASCPALPTARNMLSDCAGTAHETICPVQCASGYVQVGSDPKCQFGAWGNAVVCRPDSCETPEIPQGRAENCTGDPFVCDWACSPGYHAYFGGSDFEEFGEYTCTEGGTWTPGIEPCLPKKCRGYVPFQPNGTVTTPEGVTMEDYQGEVGETVLLECDAGFELQEEFKSLQLTCKGERLLWGRADSAEHVFENGVPSCDLVFCEATARFPFPGYRYGDERQLVCPTGYQYVADDPNSEGSVVIRCQADGTWSEPEGIGFKGCQIRTCPAIDPTSISPLRLDDYSSAPYLTTRAAECPQDMRVDGQTPVVCQADGTWSPLPTCKKFEDGEGAGLIPTDPDSGDGWKIGVIVGVVLVVLILFAGLVWRKRHAGKGNERLARIAALRDDGEEAMEMAEAGATAGGPGGSTAGGPGGSTAGGPAAPSGGGTAGGPSPSSTGGGARADVVVQEL